MVRLDAVQYVATTPVLGFEALGGLVTTVCAEACVLIAVILGHCSARVKNRGLRRFLRGLSVVYGAMFCYYGPNCFGLTGATLRWRDGWATVAIAFASIGMQALMLGLLLLAVGYAGASRL